MNVRAIQSLRRKLAVDQPVYGMWITLEAPSVAEMAVALGLDWIVIDAEHGHLDWRDILGHVRATVRSETVVLVRLEDTSAGRIKRALDIGADGVVLPWIESADHLARAVAAAQYPPAGVRGMGAERATGWGRALPQHVREANAHVLVVPIVETVKGGQAIESICRVPGVELIQLGPADYSASAGAPGQWEGPGVARQLLAIKDTIRRQGKHCGIVATGPDDLLMRQEQGFRLLGIGFDTGLLLRGLTESLARLERPTTIRPDLARAHSLEGELDRYEAIQRAAEAERISLGAGVTLRPLVGLHNHAHQLFTGLLRLEPRAGLPSYVRPCDETLTLLSGEATIEVAGRDYTLWGLDCLTIPAGVPRRVVNHSDRQPAELLMALPANDATQGIPTMAAPLEEPGFETAERPRTGERVRRHALAEWTELAPGASFQDFFNAQLGSRGVCGGYGLFEPGARLPCHRHDYDESITIVQGTASCIVEGRRYELQDNDTALVPRGRCHYFHNTSNETMAMVWVYAGDMPERMVVDESHCRCGSGEPGLEGADS